ncbi:MAG: hypothetical protein QRY71_04090, partial [Candidatus Rhabdochlamydia sp.]
MRILNTGSSFSSPLDPSLDINTMESLHIFLAEELHQLTRLEDIPRDILIKGDVAIDSSNAHAFALLQSKNVKIEGSLKFSNLSLIQIPDNLIVEKDLDLS